MRDPQTNARLYRALRALDRISALVDPQGTRVAKEVRAFLDRAWEHLRVGAQLKGLVSIDRMIGKLVVDEQEADLSEALLNSFYYAVSDLIVGLQEGNELSYAAVLEDSVELHSYLATHELLAEKGGGAFILSGEEEQRVATHPLVVAEKSAQAKDEDLAKTVSDWSVVARQ